ncbi:MAG: helix-turn-helix domain-containing protein [Aquabacterium sp.]|nr:helix-turn-helix domain-containing protein [Aquabacterium sp.]
MTERTLRRRLVAAGLTFATILDAERRTRALQLMRDGHLSIAEVAVATGFADARSLRRATRRWTGLTTRQFQAAPP